MKLGISLFILVTTVHARPIQIHFERGQKMEAIIYKELMVQDYSIPEEIISVNLVESCEGRKKQAELEICIKNNGDLQVVSVDKNFIRESLSVFKAP